MLDVPLHNTIFLSDLPKSLLCTLHCAQLTNGSVRVVVVEHSEGNCWQKTREVEEHHRREQLLHRSMASHPVQEIGRIHGETSFELFSQPSKRIPRVRTELKNWGAHSEGDEYDKNASRLSSFRFSDYSKMLQHLMEQKGKGSQSVNLRGCSAHTLSVLLRFRCLFHC